jgi:hypothetical protein
VAIFGKAYFDRAGRTGNARDVGHDTVRAVHVSRYYYLVYLSRNRHLAAHTLMGGKQ